MTKKVFDALDQKRYPEAFKNYQQQEQEYLSTAFFPTQTVLDAGCGKGRIIPTLTPHVASYTGIDIDKDVLRNAAKIAAAYENAAVQQVSIAELVNTFGPDSFDASVCLFSTIGCVYDDVDALHQLLVVTRGRAHLTLQRKGVIPLRQAYYDAIGVPCRFDENETSYSAVWGAVRAYDRAGIYGLAKNAGGRIHLMATFANVAELVVMSKKP